MHRDAMVFYLKNIRDLEVARYKIRKIYTEAEAKFKKTEYELLRTNYRNFVNTPSLASRFGTTIAIVVPLFLITMLWRRIPKLNWGSILGYLLNLETIRAVIFELPSIIVLGLAIFLLFNNIKEHKETIKKAKEVENHNLMESVREAQNRRQYEEIELTWRKQKQYLTDEYNKVDSLLGKFYSQNVLAQPYRNLESVLYIYQYMSTSQASFDDALMYERMENGIQRIAQKLDEIISKQEQTIFYNRRLETQNQQTIEQNKKMLDSLRQIENNSADAARYAKLSADYSEANAYFSLANYLK